MLDKKNEHIRHGKLKFAYHRIKGEFWTQEPFKLGFNATFNVKDFPDEINRNILDLTLHFIHETGRFDLVHSNLYHPSMQNFLSLNIVLCSIELKSFKKVGVKFHYIFLWIKVLERNFR